MSYNLLIDSTIQYVDNLNSDKGFFNLPLTEIKGIAPVITPNQDRFVIDAGASKTIDMTGKLKLFSFRSSRAVSVYIITAAKEYELPRSLYYTYMVDSKELAELVITGIRIEVPVAATPVPNPTPGGSLYPKAEVRLFTLFTD